MGLLNDGVFATIDEKQRMSGPLPGANVWGDSPYPRGTPPRPLTDEERVARVRKALDTETAPERFACDDPRCQQAESDFADWVLVRVGESAARHVMYEDLVLRNSGELFPQWKGPDGASYRNPMNLFLAERMEYEYRWGESKGERRVDVVRRLLGFSPL